MIQLNNSLLSPLRLGKLVYADWCSPPHIKNFNKLALDLLYTADINRIIVSCAVRHGKSQFWSTILPAYFLLLNPNKKVLLCSSTTDRVIEFSSKIRQIINEVGHLNGVSIDKNFRAKDNFKTNFGGGLYAFGAQSSIAGLGAHLLICDDIIRSQEDANSPTMRDKIFLWLQAEFLSRAEPGAKIVVVGSRRHLDDVSARLLRMNGEIVDDRQRWKEILFPAISSDGKALWAERYPLEKLEQIRSELEMAGQSYVWDALFMNNPTSSSITEWGENLVGSHLLTKEGDFNGRKVIAVDLACGKTDIGDNTAIVVGSFRDTNNCYIGDGMVGHMDTSATEDTVVKLISIHRPESIVIEVNGFQELVANNIYKKCMAQGIKCPLVKYTAKTDKVARIKTLITPLLHKNGLRIKDCQMGRTIIQEMREFPNGKNDDTLDAIAYCIGGFNMLTGKTETVYNPIRYI